LNLRTMIFHVIVCYSIKTFYELLLNLNEYEFRIEYIIKKLIISKLVLCQRKTIIHLTINKESNKLIRSSKIGNKNKELIELLTKKQNLIKTGNLKIMRIFN